MYYWYSYGQIKTYRKFSIADNISFVQALSLLNPVRFNPPPKKNLVELVVIPPKKIGVLLGVLRQ
ncbi:unnamed protein product, partial [Vitis vinifera]|uniref:Uncharacterized protein n=1 Tax=Vitis vinifera TaxID=29760 RepID=D7U9K3_VITVI